MGHDRRVVGAWPGRDPAAGRHVGHMLERYLSVPGGELKGACGLEAWAISDDIPKTALSGTRKQESQLIAKLCRDERHATRGCVLRKKE